MATQALAGTVAISTTCAAQATELAASKRNRILDRIVTDLASISVANGYHWTVPTGGCSREARIGIAEPGVYFPMIDVVGGPERRDYYSCDQVESKFDVEIMASVQGVNLPGLENLIADVENMLATDTTLSSLVVEIHCTQIETDGGTWANSTARMVWEVTYHHTFGAA